MSEPASAHDYPTIICSCGVALHDYPAYAGRLSSRAAHEASWHSRQFPASYVAAGIPTRRYSWEVAR